MTLRLIKRKSWMPRGTGLSHGNSTRSRPDMTALTPGNARALSKLIDLMWACGCGLRRILPQSMPGREKSAPNAARPVTLSSPSGLLVRFPIHLLFEPFAVIAALSSIFYCHCHCDRPPEPPTAAREVRRPAVRPHSTQGALNSPLSYKERARGQPRSRHARYVAMAPHKNARTHVPQHPADAGPTRGHPLSGSRVRRLRRPA